MFSLTVDYDNRRSFSVAGLASCWGWSRAKVNRFLARIGVILEAPVGAKKYNPNGQVTLQVADRYRTGSVTGTGQVALQVANTTIYPDPNPDPKTKIQKQTFSPSFALPEHSRSTPGALQPGGDDDRLKTLCASVDARQEGFERFWEIFGDKRGREKAWAAWKKINGYSPALLEKVLSGAKRYAENRPALLNKNGTPKMAQGWLTDRRWEDEPCNQANKPHSPQPPPAQNPNLPTKEQVNRVRAEHGLEPI
jgi:hypothetical protein